MKAKTNNASNPLVEGQRDADAEKLTASPHGDRALHVFTLCSFAVTQPVLTALARQSVYLHDRQFGFVEISALLLLLMMIVPAGCLGVDYFIQRVSRQFRGFGRNVVFTTLVALILLSLSRPYCSAFSVMMPGTASLLILALVIPASWLLVRLYEWSPMVRSWLSVMSIGLVIFPVIFLWQFHSILEISTTPIIEAENPVPVVMVVFDEFSGITLMNERMELDEVRFPQFARLARLSTWYRNATTVNPRTDVAVPTILSGRFPVTALPPLAAQYPRNLLELIEGTKAFEMVIFEPVSRLCPNSVRQEPPLQLSQSDKVIDLIQTLAAVYPRLIFTTDTPISFPVIPKPWFGLRMKTDLEWEQLDNAEKGLFNYSGTENRHHQLQHFLRCIQPSAKPRFAFLHTVLPHYPWTFLPSGGQYQSEFEMPGFPSAARGELGEDWDDDLPAVLRNEFRYRLQVGYVDRFIGELLDRLEATELLDQCLLIITADHGVSFHPGHSRRIPDAQNLADIFSVPLFIKLPHQSESGVDDRNVQSIDLFPTIAEVLQMKVPDPIDGLSVTSELRHPRKTLYFEQSTTVVEPDFPQRSASVRRQHSLFGNEGLDQPPNAVASHPEWHGRQIDGFVVDAITIPATLIVLPSQLRNVATEAAIEPRLITGSIAADNLPATPIEVVLVVDGIVRDTGKSYWIDRRQHGFQFLVSKSVVARPPESFELYVVDTTNGDTRLRPLKITNSEEHL